MLAAVALVAYSTLTRQNVGFALVFALVLFVLAPVARWGWRHAVQFLDDLLTGGEVDERLQERFGDSVRWGVAGALFVLGTVVQLAGTFVE